MPSESKSESDQAPHSESKEGVPPSEEVWGNAELGSVLKEAARHWGRETGYKRALEEWVFSHAGRFEDAVGVEFKDYEHSLEQYDLHKQYMDLFESQVVKYVERKDYTPLDFYKECNDVLNDFGCALFEEHEEKWFVEVLVAAGDYDNWFELMCRAAEETLGRK